MNSPSISPRALIGLGSNLGDRGKSLDQAITHLAASDAVHSVRASAWRPTRPIGGPSDQPEFLNGAALVETSLAPADLWARLQAIESALGRRRTARWQPRTIDLDLLLFDEVVLDSPSLVLPHPRLQFRRFVLEPAAEIAPSMRHPQIGWTLDQLLAHLRTAVGYVAISGPASPAKHDLAAKAAAKTSWQLLDFPAADDIVAVANSPSLALARTIEFLHKQAELLAIRRWPTLPQGVISTFWIEDLLAIGDVMFPGKLDDAWKSLSASIVAPKLLVSLESSATIPTTTQSTSDMALQPPVGPLLDSIRSARQRRAGRRGIGPVLKLDLSNPVAAEIELAAAIQAMS